MLCPRLCDIVFRDEDKTVSCCGPVDRVKVLIQVPPPEIRLFPCVVEHSHTISSEDTHESFNRWAIFTGERYSDIVLERLIQGCPPPLTANAKSVRFWAVF